VQIKDWLLPEFDHEIGATRRVLDRVPEESLTWAPHERSRTAGELATHIAGVPIWAGAVLGASSLDLDAPPSAAVQLPSREDILLTFDAAARTARTAMELPEAEYLGAWTLKRGGRDLYTMPRVMAFRHFVLNHLIHHRGQLSVYLRLLNVPVPALYGPSADEG
jgi:uncharacterized damage-inducible protein DinB